MHRDRGSSRARRETLRLSFAAFLAALLAWAPASVSAGDPAASEKWDGWAEAGGFFGTDNASRGEVAIFAPLAQSPLDLFFADLRGKLFEDEVKEGNIALGYRRMLANGWNAGAWGGFDLRHSERDNLFWQLSGGVEMLSDRWDLRANGYLPVSQPQSSPGAARVYLSGNSILMSGGEEVPLFGVDGEVGYKLFGGRPLPDGPSAELRVYAGGFYFDDDDAAAAVAGPRARAEFRMDGIVPPLPGSRLTLEGEYSYDDVRDGKWEVGARLRIPFGSLLESRAVAFSSLTAQERRMVDGLERDTDIVTGESKEEAVIDDATGVAMERVAMADSAAKLQSAVSQGSNTLIVLQRPSDGSDIDVTATSGQAMQAGQTLQGGGSAISMRGSRSGTVASFTAPGSRPTLVSTDTSSATGVVTMASHSHAAGLAIRGSGGGSFSFGNSGIRGGSDLKRVVIQQNDIADMGYHAINFDNNNDVRIVNNHMSNINSDGIFFNASNTLAIIGNTLRNGRDSGIDLNGAANTAFISGNTIRDIAFHGIFVRGGNTIAITGNRIRDTARAGISIFNPVRALSITNNIFAGSIGSNAVEFFASTGTTVTDGGGNVVLPETTVNGSAAPAASDLCSSSLATARFDGTLEITDPLGVRRTFVNGDGCG